MVPILTGPHWEACQLGDVRQWSGTWQVLVSAGFCCASHLSDGWMSPVLPLHMTRRVSKLPSWQGWWWHWHMTNTNHWSVLQSDSGLHGRQQKPFMTIN